MMNYELFFQLIKFAPELKVLQIGNSIDIAQKISEELKEYNGTLDLIVDERIEDIENVTIKIKDYNSDLDVNARNYEFVIICDIYDKVNDLKSLLSSAYHSLENSANIVLLSPKDMDTIFNLTNTLDSVGFRAINEIDISDTFTIISAKKLHMWGNGL